MILSDISIRRPVLALVTSLLLLLFGIVSFLRLPVRETPNIQTPAVTITTTYEGAAADIMESQITKPLEGAKEKPLRFGNPKQKRRFPFVGNVMA